MKKTLLLSALAVVLFATGCSKKAATPTTPTAVSNGSITADNATYKDIVVTSEPEALAVNITGTWCHACGTYGIPNFEKNLAKNPDKVNGIVIHISGSDPFITTAGNNMNSQYFKHTGTPDFWTNTNFNENSVYAQASDIDAILAKSSADAGVNMSIALDGNKLTVKSKVVFNRDLTSDYSLGLLIVEDNLDAIQTCDNPAGGSYVQVPMKHNRVLRGTALGTAVGRTGTVGDWKGVPLNTTGSSIKSGDIFGVTTTAYLDPSWTAKNLKVVAVVWSTSGTIVRSIANSNSVNVQ